MWPQRKLRGNVPTVDAAPTTKPTTRAVPRPQGSKTTTSSGAARSIGPILKAYTSELQRLETGERFPEREATPIASPALFPACSDAFATNLQAFAEAHGAPWIRVERGERKEERMKRSSPPPSRCGAPDLVLSGSPKARTNAWKGTGHAVDQGGFTFVFARVSVTSTPTTLTSGTPTWDRRSCLWAVSRGAAACTASATSGSWRSLRR